MRKILIVGIIIAFIWVLFLNTNEEKEIRVRVIPNSDTALDLQDKEKAKAMTICYMKHMMNHILYILIT